MSLRFQWQNLVESASARFSSPTMAWPLQRRSCRWEGAADPDKWCRSGHVSLGISCRRSIIEEKIETTRNINLLEHLKTCEHKIWGNHWSLDGNLMRIVPGLRFLNSTLAQVDLHRVRFWTDHHICRDGDAGPWHIVTQRVRHDLKQYQDSMRWNPRVLQVVLILHYGPTTNITFPNFGTWKY